MYITHHFDRNESLVRACYWLTQCGFEPGRLEVHPGARPRLAVIVDGLGQATAAQTIFDAIDSSADDGPAGLFDLSRLSRVMATPGAEEPRPSAIGWHPHDLDPPREGRESGMERWAILY